MVLYITDAQLTGYHPGSTPSDYTIPGDDIYSFDVEQKVGDIKDIGKLAIDNEKDQYTGIIRHGDRFSVTISGENIAGPSGFGEGGFGEGPFGGSGDRNAWTGMVRDYEIAYHGAGDSTLTIDAEDFVFAVMGMRKVYNEWRDRQIVGSNGIVNEILTDECPEISRSLLPARSETTTISAFGEYVIDVIGELALRLPAITYSVGTSLRFDPPDTLNPRFTLEPADYGTPTVGSQDENVRTQVRVRGGTAPQIDDEQLTHDGTQTVTDSSFLTHQIQTRKSLISQIDLWTKADRNGEDIIVRLQKDDGGAPIAPNDDTSDIASKRLSAEFLSENDFTLFLLPTDTENVLPEPNPWMIVQTDGSTGQDIGIDASAGIPAYKAYYAYPIVIEREDGDNSAVYRRREGEVQKSSITTFEEARDISESYLHEHGSPTKTMQFDAESTRMHIHNIGNSVQVDQPAASGAFVAVEKKDHYEKNNLATDFSFQSLESIQG